MEFAIKITETTGNPNRKAFLVDGDDGLKALKNLLKKKNFQDYYSNVTGDLKIDVIHLNENYTLPEQ